MIRLAWRYLWSQPLTAALNLLLLSLGLGAISFVLLVSEQLEVGLQRDLAGIDLVVGAKGSPMQIMLSGVFHLDVPTGNIPLETVQTLRRHPLVQEAVPLSLGDSYQGHRIVGTEAAPFLALYRAQLAEGRVWSGAMQALIGAEVARRTGLGVGSHFAGSHGLAGGAAHEGQAFEVVGVLAPTGGVLDRLILTDLASVWELHEAHHDEAADPAEREVTLVLVRYRSPLAAVSLPRWVNAQPGLQAAAPALETARLMRMMGAGTEVLHGFGAVMLLAAGLSVGIALLHAVRARQGDLAMLRMLGAPAYRVAGLVALEALWLALVATLLGLCLGHGLAQALGAMLERQQSLHLTGAAWAPQEVGVPVVALGLAVACAAWPAWRAYRLDVTTLLQAPR